MIDSVPVHPRTRQRLGKIEMHEKIIRNPMLNNNNKTNDNSIDNRTKMDDNEF